MSIEKVLEKLKNQSIKDDTWTKEAEWREKNEAWLDLSFAIAVKILRTLRNRNMTQKDLAETLGLTPQYVNKIVKGSENLTIETITKIEKALGVQLIQVPEYSFSQIYEVHPATTPKPKYYALKAYTMVLDPLEVQEGMPCKQPEKAA